MCNIGGVFLKQSRQGSSNRDKRLREIIFTMMLISQGIRHDNQEVFLTNINLFYHVAKQKKHTAKV